MHTDYPPHAAKISAIPRGAMKLRGGSLAILAALEYQAKPGWSCELKGVHHVNCSFVHVAEPERGGATRLVETGEANLRAVAQANPIRPRYANGGGQSARDDEA